MPNPHNRDECKKQRNGCNDNRINKSKMKAKHETGQPSDTSKPKKLTLSKSLPTALTTNFGVSNADTSRLIEDALK